MNVEDAVRERYSAAAADRSNELCCPVDYDPRYLEVIPQEILDRDYGCGDPSRHVREGETVLDLGSGGGKICFIASQVVGADGQVIGVDMNDEMLSLARSHAGAVGERIGWNNVTFLKGKIQDLTLDYDRVSTYLDHNPVEGVESLERFEAWKAHVRATEPMIPDDGVDVVVSNCVLNLVQPEDRRRMFAELRRVLRPGGRAVISDIVSDEEVPLRLQTDPELWSGCISGAYREDAFIDAFADAGLYGVRVLSRDDKPWRTVEGIEFRSLTVEAYKAEEGPELDRNQAVIYRGPWHAVLDEDGNVLERGRSTAVSDRKFAVYTGEPYASQIDAVPPREGVPAEEAQPFDYAEQARVRTARETKGEGYRRTDTAGEDCC
jgi:SAM-dependent methyltransferase